jgi:hypothetical protein
MARPITPTPTLEGEDAESLLKQMEGPHASPEEMARRVERAKEQIEEVMRPKDHWDELTPPTFEEVEDRDKVIAAIEEGRPLEPGVYAVSETISVVAKRPIAEGECVTYADVQTETAYHRKLKRRQRMARKRRRGWA